jgi:hypothetical protein
MNMKDIEYRGKIHAQGPRGPLADDQVPWEVFFVWLKNDLEQVLLKSSLGFSFPDLCNDAALKASCKLCSLHSHSGWYAFYRVEKPASWAKTTATRCLIDLWRLMYGSSATVVVPSGAITPRPLSSTVVVPSGAITPKPLSPGRGAEFASKRHETGVGVPWPDGTTTIAGSSGESQPDHNQAYIDEFESTEEVIAILEFYNEQLLFGVQYGDNESDHKIDSSAGEDSIVKQLKKCLFSNDIEPCIVGLWIDQQVHSNAPGLLDKCKKLFLSAQVKS